MGPLEATIHNLSNEIAQKKKGCAELEYFWLRSQTELVNLNKQIEKESEAMQDMDRQLTVLKQKQMRLDGESSLSRYFLIFFSNFYCLRT